MPNQDTLFKLLLGYCHRGDIEGSKQILQHAKSLGMSLTEQVYSAFILGKGRAGYVVNACMHSHTCMYARSHAHTHTHIRMHACTCTLHTTVPLPFLPPLLPSLCFLSPTLFPAHALLYVSPSSSPFHPFQRFSVLFLHIHPTLPPNPSVLCILTPTPLSSPPRPFPLLPSPPLPSFRFPPLSSLFHFISSFQRPGWGSVGACNDERERYHCRNRELRSSRCGLR